VVETLSNRPPDLRGLSPTIRVARPVNPHSWILEAPTARDAVDAALALGHQAGIRSAVPTRKRPVRPHFPRSAIPNDPYFARQYSLETVDATAAFLPPTVDLNARGAWAWTRGEQVTVGVADDGIERTHPDLAANAGGPNYNFLIDTPNGDPMARSLFHGTAVAGLIAAVGGNRVGLTGMAPHAKLASWVIFDNTDTNQPDEVGFADMFGTANQEVGVQNHSWGNADYSFVELTAVEDQAIQKAVTEGRGGRGVVLVRSAGNTRQSFPGARAGDANLDGYANDPRQITVAAVRPDGRVSSYSTPGACVLVAAPGGDFRGGYPGLITTDRTGLSGLNGFRDPGDPDSWDYLIGTRLFVGTSAAAPLVSGVAALLVSVRPDLHWNEIQQLLALSARHLDLTDADLRTNGAGFRVSPNTGFGIPDAGTAVRLARSWALQPRPETVRLPQAGPWSIPDPLLTTATTPLALEFTLTNSLVLHHVRLRVRWSHARGSQLRVTLQAPSGLASGLLRTNTEDEPVPADWTFSSAHHLGESARGVWKLEITDTVPGETGTLEEAELIVDGLPIQDDDADGLDDAWEQRWLGSVNFGPADDPDRDGWSNAAEQLAGRDPSRLEESLTADVSKDPDGRLRLTWPGTAQNDFQVWSRSSPDQPSILVTNVPGRFPETGWRLPPSESQGLYEVRPLP
jgi:subtilisin family serine protease